MSAVLLLLPSWVLCTLLVAIFVGLSLAALFMIRRRYDHTILARNNEVIGFVFAGIGAIYGVLLAFVVVAVWEEYNKADELAQKEVSEIIGFSRDLSIYPKQEEVAPIRTALYKYLTSITHEEYPAMAQRKRSNVTNQAMLQVWEGIKNIKPENIREQVLYSAILNDLDKVDNCRFERLDMAENELPSIVWAVLLLGAGITLVFAILFGMRSLLAHGIIVSLLATLIAINIFLIVELNHPFTGEVSPSTERYLEILENEGITTVLFE